MTEFRCPHCDKVLTEVCRYDTVPVRQAFSKTPRGPYRVTEDFLAQVLAIHETGGVPALLESFGGSERNARRWLALARNGSQP